MSAGHNYRKRLVAGKYVPRFCDICSTTDGNIFPVKFRGKISYWCSACFAADYDKRHILPTNRLLRPIGTADEVLNCQTLEVNDEMP